MIRPGTPAESMNVILAVVFALAGFAILFAKVDGGQLKKYTHTMPGYALFRFAWFRMGAVAMLFGLAAVAYIAIPA